MTCPFNPRCTFLRPQECRGDARARCIETQVIRIMHPEAWRRWCEEDDRAFALEAELDAAFALPAPAVLVAREVPEPAGAQASPSPEPVPPRLIRPKPQVFDVRTPPKLEDQVVELYGAGLTVARVAGRTALSIATVSRILGRRGARRSGRAA